MFFHKDGGWIQSADGSTTHFERVGDSYIRSVWIDVDVARAQKVPFIGQEPNAL